MADIFRSQVRFYGKHGQYLEALTPGTERAKDTSLSEIERNKYLFDTVVDIYVVAPIVGYLYQRKAPRDGNEATKNIMEGAATPDDLVRNLMDFCEEWEDKFSGDGSIKDVSDIDIEAMLKH